VIAIPNIQIIAAGQATWIKCEKPTAKTFVLRIFLKVENIFYNEGYWLQSTKMVTVWKYRNLPVMFATWIWADCVNLCGRCELNSCAFNCLSKQMLIITANVWRPIDVLTEANYSFQQGI